MVRFGDHVTVDKNEVVAGDVVVIGGSIDVLGKVSGDVVSIGGEVTVHEGAVVNGQAVCVGGPVHQEDGSEIRGEVVSLNLGGPLGIGSSGGPLRSWHLRHSSPLGFVARLFSLAVGLGVLFGLACLVILVFGTQVDRIAGVITRDPFRSGAIGLLTVVALPPVIFLVAVTVIGIPAAIVLGLVWFLANAFGMVAVSRATGARVAASYAAGRSPYSATGVGMLVLSGPGRGGAPDLQGRGRDPAARVDLHRVRPAGAQRRLGDRPGRGGVHAVWTEGALRRAWPGPGPGPRRTHALRRTRALARARSALRAAPRLAARPRPPGRPHATAP